jgi:hypothetical protein
MADTITLSRSLYSPEAVTRAVAAYAALAKLEVSVGDDAIEVRISEPDPDVEEVLADELCNHILFETIKERSVSDDMVGVR